MQEELKKLKSYKEKKKVLESEKERIKDQYMTEKVHMLITFRHHITWVVIDAPLNIWNKMKLLDCIINVFMRASALKLNFQKCTQQRR